MAEKPRDPASLERVIRQLLDRPLSDLELRAALEDLGREPNLAGLTWVWGPELYRRNRVLFRPFILAHFGNVVFKGAFSFERVSWTGRVAAALDPWLREADRLDDIELFRRLHAWKLTPKRSWRPDAAALRAELLRRARAATTPARRATEVAKLDVPFPLDEATALGLYEIDPKGAASFILKHLPGLWTDKRALWRSLFDAAMGRGDEDFAFKLYRRQVAVAAWNEETRRLAAEIADPAELVAALERRHPEGWGLDLGATLHALARERGREVLPYVARHLKDVWPRWHGRGSYASMLALAQERGWIDLWSALVRVCATPADFNQEVARLVADRSRPEAEVLTRLGALVGVSREWSWPGLGLAQVHQLSDATALALYRRFPDLLRGPYKLHIQVSGWGEAYPDLIEHLLESGDDELIDFLAARLLTRGSFRWGESKAVAEAERLASYYQALKDGTPGFARRAARVLGQVPAYAIFSYDSLIRRNRLARLLFERSAAEYLEDAGAVADLVEASEIHVQALAYRTLALDDPRARALAHESVELLLGTLMRPLHRATRTAAFGALANAAGSPESARRILARAREALCLPDIRYPKEELVGLIGRILHRFPELAGPAEQPVVVAGGRR